MKKLIPLLFLLVGAGAGVGAGIMLRPEAASETAGAADGVASDNLAAIEGMDENAGHDGKEQDAEHENSTHDDENSNEYAKLNNQFVVPGVS